MHLVIFMAFANFIDQIVNGINHGIKRVFITRQHHPHGQRPGTTLVESIKRHINNAPDIRFAFTILKDNFCNGIADLGGKVACQCLLQPGSGAEMMQQIGVGSPNAAGNGLECHGLWACFDKERAGSFQCGETTGLRAKAFTRC